MADHRLTAGDRVLYVRLREVAREGLPCPSTDDLVELMDCESNSTPAESLRRLEMAALIRVRRYQRHRVVTITETGDTTAEPSNPQPHWRDRPLGAAAGALKLAEIAAPGSSDRIRELATIQRITVPDMIGQVLLRGLAEMAK